MAIDLGNDPGGTPPTTAEKLQIRSAIGVGTTDAPTFLGVNIGINSFLTESGELANTRYGTTYWRSSEPVPILLRGNGALGWSSGTSQPLPSGDTFLYRDGAPGILAQRNGSSPQAFRVANQVGASPLVDYDRGVFDFKTTTNTLRIGTENGGTYTLARPIEFVTGGVVRMSIAGTGLTTIDSIPVSRGAGTNTLNIAIGGGLVNNSTGGANSAVGVNALFYNTTGGNNSAVGYSSLQNNTTGGNNSTVGVSALFNNTTGQYNSAVGVAALLNNTVGQYNSALGVQALFGNSTGGNNSAFGYQAGRYIADGTTANATGANSIYLGVDTKALANGQTNQTVIGYNATGSGSNSTTLNNTSATLTKINGTSAHVLDVTGTIKLSPPASVTPANNGELMVEATSNTTLTFKFKGNDGTVRSGTVILA